MKLNTLIKVCDFIIEKFIIFMMAVLVLDVTWQVITRYALSSPSSYTEELARYLLIWIGLLGATLAYRHNMHLSFDLLLQKVNNAQKRMLQLFIHSVIAIFAGLVLCWGGLKLALLTWELNQVSASLGVRLAYVYAIIPISGLLMVIYAMNFINDYYQQER